MGADLGDLALLEDDDLVGGGGAGEAVADEDGGLVLAQPVELAEDLLLGNGVQGGGRLVQDQDVRVRIEGAGDA